MVATKTTFYLPDELRQELKKLAAARRKTVTDLLTEGARNIVAHARKELDAGLLRQRALEARRRLRDGIYAGAAISGVADEMIYPAKTSSDFVPSQRRRRRHP